MKTVFQKIIDGELPCNKVFENERIIAFHDIAPQAPVHILVVPKKPIADLAHITPEDGPLLAETLLVAKEIAKTCNLQDFRLLTNNGRLAGQTIFHLHFHLLGGRELGDLG